VIQSVVVESFARVDFRGMFLPMFVVCENPADFPGKFTVRVHEARTGAPTSLVLVADTLAAARYAIPAGRVCLARSPDDDRVIVETWF